MRLEPPACFSSPRGEMSIWRGDRQEREDDTTNGIFTACLCITSSMKKNDDVPKYCMLAIF